MYKKYICTKRDLELNNLRGLIYHETQLIKQPTKLLLHLSDSQIDGKILLPDCESNTGNSSCGIKLFVSFDI